jgi:hypothetical protein
LSAVEIEATRLISTNDECGGKLII